MRRVYQHKEKLLPGFTSRYDVRRLVWFEVYDDPVNAIEREKEIKKWHRDWKIALIEKNNPDWRDLYPEITGQVLLFIADTSHRGFGIQARARSMCLDSGFGASRRPGMTGYGSG